MDVYGVFTFFQTACSLLYLNAAELEEALIMRITVAGSTSIKGRWRQQQSEVLKESLCKGIFERLFHWAVKQINKNISSPEGMSSFIGAQTV